MNFVVVTLFYQIFAYLSFLFSVLLSNIYCSTTIVSNNDYVYKCDIIRANGIKTLLHVKKDLSKEGINSYIYVEGKLTSEEYLNNLLVSYKQTEEQVEEEMDREALLEDDE